jgi:hypothetical protein
MSQFEYIYPVPDTHNVITSHINKNIKSQRSIYINFTTLIIKTYKTIYIHCVSEKNMQIFLNKFNTVLKNTGIPRIDKTNLEYKKSAIFEDSLYDECEWYEMPEFKPNNRLNACASINLEIEVIDIPLFRNFQENYFNEFGQTIFPKTKIIWYPNRSDTLSPLKNKMYYETTYMPKYPIYIISKGRYKKRLTSRYLEWCNIPYKIVIEPQEYDLYAMNISPSKILVLPDEYLNKNQGGIPARNFVWKHSKDSGYDRHWILDDNIAGYFRYNNSQKFLLKGGSAFRIIEDYVDRYSNVKMAGHNYTFFAITTNTDLKPITINTRIYSTILLSNDIFPEFYWRGKYNEDTDLSLRILKAGYPTILFNNILADKSKTLTQSGGNTDTIYNVENSMYLKAASLQEQHPDVVKIVQRFGRDHHYVNYEPFKELKPIFIIDKLLLKKSNNEYNMELVKKDNKDLLPGKN